jgi:alkylation response protein AidB-like acyl-CoA dehydrogenase
MIELDDALAALAGQVREWAPAARAVALDLDADPDAVYRYLDLPVVSYLATTLIPPEFNPGPLVIGRHRFYGMRALERVVAVEEAACGDAGLLLAAPGASLSGVVVDLLGSPTQKEWFYGRLLAAPTWTFCALTEPDRGSDISAMTTALTPADGAGGAFRLTGAKKYIGNAARAQVGVVFARARPGPLGIRAVLVQTSAAGFAAVPLPMIGLRGAQIASVTLDGVEVDAGGLLGQHLSPTRRGIWTSVQMFNRLRPGVAAIALGIARAAREYIEAGRPPRRVAEQDWLDQAGARIDAVRQLIWRAAAAIDADPADGYLASAAKARAARLAADVTAQALRLRGPGARLEHPLLDKLARDAIGVEFMEGTGHIQLLNLFQGLIHGKLSRD